MVIVVVSSIIHSRIFRIVGEVLLGHDEPRPYHSLKNVSTYLLIVLPHDTQFVFGCYLELYLLVYLFYFICCYNE